MVGITEAGTRIVGWAEGHKGLAEYFVAREDAIVELDDELTDVEATVVQPLCTVLHQLDRVDVAGKRVAVIGQGPIGLLFSHACKARGAAHVTGVDRVDRGDCAAAFGVDEAVWDDATAWAQEAEADIVVEAIGHHAGPLEAAVEALAPHGTVLAFGVPDESHYAFPFTAFFRKHATLIAGAATDRAQALAGAREYLREHRSLLAPYITNVLAVERAQEAFELAVDPVVGRLKVVLEVALMRFTATLEDRYVIVPFDVRAEWGEARPPVAGTLNGVPFRTRIAVYGGQYVLGFTNAIRKQAGVVAGRRGRDRARARRCAARGRDPAGTGGGADRRRARGVRCAQLHPPARVRGVGRGGQAA